MDLAGVDGDQIPGPGLHGAASAGGGLGAAPDQTEPELIMAVAAKPEGGIGGNGLYPLPQAGGAGNGQGMDGSGRHGSPGGEIL
ncbi:hypothetical protein GCM10027256_10500 [Novispirillum itersonii subsp. nipponicum]